MPHKPADHPARGSLTSPEGHPLPDCPGDGRHMSRWTCRRRGCHPVPRALDGLGAGTVREQCPTRPALTAGPSPELWTRRGQHSPRRGPSQQKKDMCKYEVAHALTPADRSGQALHVALSPAPNTLQGDWAMGKGSRVQGHPERPVTRWPHRPLRRLSDPRGFASRQQMSHGLQAPDFMPQSCVCGKGPTHTQHT